MGRIKNIALASTVRAEYQELACFIKHYQAIGVDVIILFFDDPNDSCIKRIRDNFQAVILIKCDDAYWKARGIKKPDSIEERQTVNVNEALNIGTIKGSKWLVNVDVDELVYCEHDLKKALENYENEEIDAVRFDVLEAVPEKAYYASIFEPTLFRANPSEKRIALAKALGCSSVLFNGEYFRGHLASKLAIRVSSNVSRIKIHNVEMKKGEAAIVRAKHILLLHFDSIGVHNWQQKWDRRVDGTGKASEMRGNRKKQLDFYLQAKKGGPKVIERSYLKLYGINFFQKRLLLLLGMLQIINLKEKHVTDSV